MLEIDGVKNIIGAGFETFDCQLDICNEHFELAMNFLKFIDIVAMKFSGAQIPTYSFYWLTSSWVMVNVLGEYLGKIHFSFDQYFCGFRHLC